VVPLDAGGHRGSDRGRDRGRDRQTSGRAQGQGFQGVRPHSRRPEGQGCDPRGRPQGHDLEARVGGRRMTRRILGFFVAPLLPACIWAWVSPLRGEYHGLSLLIIFCMAFYALQATVGIAGYFVLRRTNKHGPLSYAGVGAFTVSLPINLLLSY